MTPRPLRLPLVLGLHALALFASATIIFMLQPLVGKMLLPVVGGTPAGWIVALAFFQIMLLLGYLLAHGLSKCPPVIHGIFYLCGLGVGLSFLPFSFEGALYSETPGAADIFLLLVRTVALPFIAISATASTVQRLFTTTGHPSAADPYFLYAASNLGSFAGLLLYPLVIEPLLTLHQQQAVLRGAYAMLILLVLGCLLLSGRQALAAAPDAAPATPIPWRRRFEWLALSFLPSSLLLGVTIHITTDVISAPMIWILPLALYLLTFVIAFGKSRPVMQSKLEESHADIILACIVLTSLLRPTWMAGFMGVGFYLGVFTLIALICHTRLAALRPPGKHLTGFYLAMSVGGALGGVVNAFIVPAVFNRVLEFPLMLLASFALHPAFTPKSRGGMIYLGLLVLSVFLVNMPAPNIGMTDLAARWSFAIALLFMICCLAPRYQKTMLRPGFVAMSALLIFMVTQFLIGESGQILSTRNFYGTIRVYDRKGTVDGTPTTLRVMQHGSTVHGTQWRDPAHETQPTSYYVTDGPFGDIFSISRPRRVGVLGLGAGASNCYADKNRDFTFFELDPAVIRVAEEDFTFLRKCVSRDPPRIITGDGAPRACAAEGREI